MNNQKKKKHFLPLIILLAVLACAAAVIAAMIPGAEEQVVPTQPAAEPTEAPATIATEIPTPTGPLLRIESVEHLEDKMVMTTTCGRIAYPFAFSDLIDVQAESDEQTGTLVFSVLLGDKAYTLYTVTFGDGEGIPLGTLTLDDGSTVKIWGQLAQIPDELSQADALTYGAAQETFNDVAASLAENENITPTD